MNQINGYCQIELPDRISLEAITSKSVALTDAEVKPIIKALNLDQVLANENDYASYINAWLNKPVIVKAYVPTVNKDVKSIFYASFVSSLFVGDVVSIQFTYDNGGGSLRHISINIVDDSEQTGIYMTWGVRISARQITTTPIA